ncbi:winged helix-turn-helix domain-containing protein [Lysobacter sp. Hz 25]|uniref:winged helix-turn-helix domain-containing protein n=1 Tax=Lysobacter sp. Hz 25 TaxID=3383698 RepID=UPI0038D3F370
MQRIHTPAARATDPATSHLAADAITASGARDAQQQLAAEVVRQHPGYTSNELAQFCELDRYALARRLPECATAGAVRKGRARTCRVSGRSAVTWWPVDATALAAA